MSAPNALVGGLAGARKAVQLYPPAHPTYAEAMEAFVAAVAAVTSEGPFVLNVHQGRLYAGSDPIADDSPAAVAAVESLEARRVESLTFAPGFAVPDAIGLTEVLNLRPSPELDFCRELVDRGVTTVVAAFVTEDADAAEHRAARDKMRDEDRAMYRRLVGQLRTLSQRVAAQDTPDVTEASAMVGSILGRLMEDQSAVLGLATIRSHSEATLFHSISVMIYALALGRQLGLPEEGLTSLGVSALMHDIGKAAFDGADPEQVRAAELLHPTVGAEILAALPDDDKAPMLVAYEHHMGVDGSGFPERAPDYFGHPFSRMVAVANRYENLVKPLGSAEALTPERAVARLMAESNGPLDPIFTRLFIKAVGVLPIGTLVRLSDHTIAVVARVDGESDPLAPVVRPVYDADGAAIVDPEDIDLSTDERYVAEAIDQDTLRVEVSEHL